MEYLDFLDEKMMTTKEATEYLGVTRMALSLWVKEGRIRRVKRGVYLASDIKRMGKNKHRMYSFPPNK